MTTMTTTTPAPKRLARFRTTLSNGGTATWTAEVVRLDHGIALVRHPKRARTLPFSPVPANALYRYDASKLAMFVK
jgi:hypothetical protein